MDLYPEPRGREASVEYVAGPGLLMLPGLMPRGPERPARNRRQRTPPKPRLADLPPN
jgi:hypothetical protein